MKVGCWILFVFVFMNATFIGCRLQVQTSKINYLTSSVYQFITSTLNTKTSAQCWFKIETRTKTAMAESQNSSVHKWEVWFYFNLYTAAPFPARNGQSAFLLPLHNLWVILKFEHVLQLLRKLNVRWSGWRRLGLCTEKGWTKQAAYSLFCLSC